MFGFRLENVLRVRRRREEAAAIELARAEMLRRERLALLAEAQRELGEHRAALGDLFQGGVLARDLLLHHDGGLALEARIEREKGLVAQLGDACEDRRLALVERSKEKEMLERLKDKQRELWRLAEARGEQKALDEVAVLRRPQEATQERG
jgi:flagellar FliJ protein